MQGPHRVLSTLADQESYDLTSARARDLTLNSFLPAALVLLLGLILPVAACSRKLIVSRVMRSDKIRLGSYPGIIRTNLVRSIPCA
jgi:hypothetical protein